MSFGEDDNEGPSRRLWHKEDRAKISLLELFREHFEDTRPIEDETTLTRKIHFRQGITEAQLREHIEHDLVALLNTIRLDAACPLDDAPHVAASILNYGFRDLSDVSVHDLHKSHIVDSIRQSLVDHEPRLATQSIRIDVRTRDGGVRQRLAIFVEADLIGDPVNIPLDFDAEVDTGAGKLRMTGLRVQV